MIFLCSPNNPSGGLIRKESLLRILEDFGGIVVLDEAYTDFCPEASMLPELANHPNLVVLQTLSKAWGMAGIRLGMCFGDPQIIRFLNRIKPPYNINTLSQQKSLELLQNEEAKNERVKRILDERENLRDSLLSLGMIMEVFPSDSNFLLVRFRDAARIFTYLTDRLIIVRDRSSVTGCEGCLRITVGTREENRKLLDALNNYE